MSKFYPPYKKEVFEKSLELRKKLTFKSKKDIFLVNPPFPREITLDINNRCNHKCYFCANPKIREYDALDLKLAFFFTYLLIKLSHISYVIFNGPFVFL